MMRFAVFVAALLLPAQMAGAEPPSAQRSKKAEPKKAEPKKAEPKKPDPSKKAEPGDKAAKPGRGLERMAADLAAGASATEPAPTPVGAQRLDLTPARLFGKGDVGVKSDRRGKEKGSGMSLGDGDDWRGQAIQIGAMAAGFAALVGLCGGGKCMLPSPSFLPESPQGPPPDLQIRENYREPRPAR